MKIGIVIPCHNDAKYIDDCLRSIDYPVDHIVIVNDASPYEEMKEKLREIKEKNMPNLTVLEHEVNKRLPSTRNTGIKWLLENTDAELIIPMDADDMFAPSWIGGAASFMSTDQGGRIDIVSGSCHTMQNLIQVYFPQGQFNPHTNDGCPASSTVFRRRVFEKHLYDETMVEGFEDWHLINCCILEGFMVMPMQTSALIYRAKDESESMYLQADKKRPELLKYMHKVYREHYAVDV